MNLFVAGWSRDAAVPAEAAVGALDALLVRLPFLAGEPRRSWIAPSGQTAAAWVSHAADRVGDVAYAAAETSRLALWSGRPVLWDSSGEADGRAPLHPRLYLRPTREWADRLDGRCTVVRIDDSERRLEVFSDSLGAYPIFETEGAGVTWISNNAQILHELSGDDTVDETVLAGLLGGGWSLAGHPLWRAVRRLPRGTLHDLRPNGRSVRELLALRDIAGMPGAPLDVSAAGSTLVANAAALADWPGRENVVPTTAGRDSRLVLAAAVAAGFEFSTVTGGSEDDPDVVIGRHLAETAGVSHGRLPADPHGSMFSNWRRGARLLALQTAGTATLADAAGFPHGPREGALPLWHSGQGGEIARRYYARVRGRTPSALVASLYSTFVARRPGRAEPLNEDGVRLVRGELAAFVEQVMDAGAAAHDVGDLFYLLRRMGTWAGPTHGSVEWVRDTTSPLWSSRMLVHELAGSPRERGRETFHLRLLEHLFPQLVDVPLQGGQPWAAHHSEAARRARRALALATKASGAARRRASPRVEALARRLRASDGDSATGRGAGASLAPSMTAREAPVARDPFAAMRDDLREVALSAPDHPAWGVLDGERVRVLLTRDTGSLDEMSRLYVWRLATVFGAPA